MIDSVSDVSGASPDLKKARRQKSASRNPQSVIDRLPPHAPDMERGVLGCCLISPNDCVAQCIEKLRDDGASAFYDLRHQTIYQALVEMFNERSPIDLITVQ